MTMGDEMNSDIGWVGDIMMMMFSKHLIFTETNQVLFRVLSGNREQTKKK